MMAITGLLCQSCQRHNSQRDGRFSHNIVVVVTGWPYVGVPLHLIFTGSPVDIEYGNLIIGDLYSPQNDPDPGTDRSEMARPGTTELVDFEAIPPFHLVIYLSLIRRLLHFRFFYTRFFRRFNPLLFHARHASLAGFICALPFAMELVHRLLATQMPVLHRLLIGILISIMKCIQGHPTRKC